MFQLGEYKFNWTQNGVAGCLQADRLAGLSFGVAAILGAQLHSMAFNVSFDYGRR